MLRRGVVVLVAGAMTLVGSGAAQAAVTSHISATYNTTAEKFHGKVTSSNSECVAHRTVKLFKKTPSGNRLAGKVASGSNGGWRIEVMNAHGNYFAKIPTEKEMGVTCGGARSDVVDVM
jgi:hypothetical protein